MWEIVTNDAAGQVLKVRQCLLRWPTTAQLTQDDDKSMLYQRWASIIHAAPTLKQH